MPATTTKLRVRDVMNGDPISVTPSMTLSELARVLNSNEISGVPVVDGQDRVIGVVSKTDLVRHFIDQPDRTRESGLIMDIDEEEMISFDDLLSDSDEVVEVIMSNEPLTARQDDSIGSVARRMADERVHRVIVTDENGQLLGIVTSLDLLRHIPA